MANPTARVPITTTGYDEAGVKTIVNCSNTAQTFYAGEAIGRDSSGNAEKCDATAARKFVGLVSDVSRVTVDSGDAAGDKKLVCVMPRYAIVSIRETAAAGDEGRPVWWQFSNQVSYFAKDDSTEFSNFCGYVHRVVSNTEVEVEVVSDGPKLSYVNWTYVNSSCATVFLAERPCRVVDIRGRPTTVNAATADIVKVPTTCTVAQGVSLLAASAVYNFNSTADINQIVNLNTNTSVLELAAGDSIAIKGNAATAAVGIVTITIAPRAR